MASNLQPSPNNFLNPKYNVHLFLLCFLFLILRFSTLFIFGFLGFVSTVFLLEVFITNCTSFSF